MALNFSQTLQQGLKNIRFTGEYHELLVHEDEIERDIYSSCEIIETYGKLKWKIVDLLNQKYSTIIKSQFDLYNWLTFNDNDEVSYFLNEAGSNCLNYSEYKVPHKFHLWLGYNGFVIGVEQRGNGFNAEEVHTKKLKENEGAAFTFFRECKSKIFFDNSKNAKVVYMEWLW